MLYSCERPADAETAAEEVRMTEYSENLSIVNSQNGRRSYHFETPLLEGYTLAREPYREFRKGVKITTYKDDSLTTVDAVLTANYAIYYEKRELWEAKGDVVVEKSDGKTLYTQQLFWNARTKKIYSNVDSKIVQRGGTDVFIGEGFESDEEFKDWRFRRMKGRMEVDVTPGTGADTTAQTPRPAADAPRGGTGEVSRGPGMAAPVKRTEAAAGRPNRAGTGTAAGGSLPGEDPIRRDLEIRSDEARIRPDASRRRALDARRTSGRAKTMPSPDSVALRLEKPASEAAVPGK